MTIFYVMQTGRTTWEDQARVEPTAGSPLSAQGVQTVRDIAEQLRDKSLGAVHAGAGQSEQQAAALAAKTLGLKVRTDERLGEIDYGLWQGLTVEEIKRSQPTRYKQWIESPSSVSPPGGESLVQATQRLQQALGDIAKHRRKSPALLVLRPVMVGLLRCLLRGEPIDSVWKNVDPAFAWERCETENDKT